MTVERRGDGDALAWPGVCAPEAVDREVHGDLASRAGEGLDHDDRIAGRRAERDLDSGGQHPQRRVATSRREPQRRTARKVAAWWGNERQAQHTLSATDRAGGSDGHR